MGVSATNDYFGYWIHVSMEILENFVLWIYWIDVGIKIFKQISFFEYWTYAIIRIIKKVVFWRPLDLCEGGLRMCLLVRGTVLSTVSKQWIQTNALFLALFSFWCMWGLLLSTLQKSRAILEFWSPSFMNFPPTIAPLIALGMADMGHGVQTIHWAPDAKPYDFFLAPNTLLLNDILPQATSFLIGDVELVLARSDWNLLKLKIVTSSHYKNENFMLHMM